MPGVIVALEILHDTLTTLVTIVRSILTFLKVATGATRKIQDTPALPIGLLSTILHGSRQSKPCSTPHTIMHKMWPLRKILYISSTSCIQQLKGLVLGHVTVSVNP